MFVGVLCLVPVLLFSIMCAPLALQPLNGEGGDDCFALTVFLMYCALPWVGLRCMIVVFPDYAHLHFCTG